MVKIAPSTDPAENLDELLKYAEELEPLAHFLHVDVMDGKFVEKTTLNSKDVEVLNSNTSLMLDVHLMAENPDVKSYILAGANIVTVHYEAFEDKKNLISTLKEIRSLGALAGLSLKPKTDILDIVPYLSLIDIVLVMSVEPGKSGQKFINETIKKVVDLRNYINDDPIQIEVDGGINPQVAKKLIMAGANILVSGNYIYSSKNRKEAINSLINP